MRYAPEASHCHLIAKRFLESPFWAGNGPSSPCISSNATLSPCMQAIELLIERLAAQAVREEGESGASSAVQARSAAQAETAAMASSAEIPAASQECSRQAGELDAQAAIPEQQFCRSLESDENSAAPESVIAEGPCTGEERGTSPAGAVSEGCLERPISMCSMEKGKGSTPCGNTDQQDTNHGKQDAPNHREPKVAGKHEKKPARNRPCPCGSGRRYKECCGPVQAAQKRRQANGLQPPEHSEGHGHVMAELYV